MDEERKLLGNFWEIFENFHWKFYWKIEFLFFNFIFYFIFRKFVTINRAFGNNTSFLQHFFGFGGGGSPFPPGYALVWSRLILANLTTNNIEYLIVNERKPFEYKGAFKWNLTCFPNFNLFLEKYIHLSELRKNVQNQIISIFRGLMTSKRLTENFGVLYAVWDMKNTAGIVNFRIMIWRIINIFIRVYGRSWTISFFAFSSALILYIYDLLNVQ